MKTSLKVTVEGTKAIAELTDALTSGMVGVPVTFQFDESWEELRRLAVFEGSGQKKYIDLDVVDEPTIPWEVLLEARTAVKVGVEGRLPDGTVVIPTRWADVGVILSGAQAGEDPALQPTPTVYDQIMQAIDAGKLKGADGLTPYIGGNGNWWLGEEDTGIKAEGEDGYTPVKGVDYWTEADQQEIDSHIAEEVAALGDHSTIVNSATGETILLTDSAEQKLRGLKLYGKSTQDGTPTPESPVEIVSAGADGDIGVTVCGGNLMPPVYATYEKDGVEIVFNGNQVAISGTNSTTSEINTSTAVSIPLPVAEGTYSITSVIVSGFAYSLLVAMITNADGTKTFKSGSYTLDGTEQAVALYARVPAGITANVTIDAMANKGDTVLSYEPYKEPQSLTTPTPNGLPGIKASSGGNYTDSDGQQWICDEIDFARGVYVQRVKVVYLGDYEWNDAWNNGNNISGTFLGYYHFADGTKYLGGRNSGVTHFSYTTSSILTSGETAYDCGQGDSSNIAIRVPTSIASTKEELKAWLAANNVQFLYSLATPIETPLTAEEMAQFTALHTNYPTTTILNDEGVGMEVSYVADTKNYIDKKFDELAAAIVANA